MHDERFEFLRDKRPLVVRTVLSLAFVLPLLMVLIFVAGIAAWKISSDTAKSSVSELVESLIDEIGEHTVTSLSKHLDTAEDLTSLNAGLFYDRTFSEHNVSLFMTAFRTQLEAFSASLTTVSMTTKAGHLHGVYRDASGAAEGYWASETVDGVGYLLDYNTTAHANGSANSELLYRIPYNSSTKEWYTVCNVSQPGHKAWTSIYTMSEQTPVTMLSESSVAYTPDGLMGVTTIDMALGFAGELLRSVSLPEGYHAFVVDAGVNAVIGTADNTPLLYCRRDGILAPLRIGECAQDEMVFLPADTTTVPYIHRAYRYVSDNHGGWQFVSQVTGTINLDSGTHFINVNAITRSNLRWVVVLLLPEDVYLEDVNNTAKWVLVLHIMVLITQAFLCALIVYFFVTPLRRLANDMAGLTDFAIDEDSMRLSAWSEIRALQLTFLTLLRHMRVVKSFLPQALFAEDVDAESDAEKSTGRRRTVSSHVSQVRSSVSARVAPRARGFEWRRNIAIVAVHVEHEACDTRDPLKVHTAHGELLSQVSKCVVACRGTLDQVTGECIHIVWGRETTANLTNVVETVLGLGTINVNGTQLWLGCAVGSGYTGNVGNDTIRTVATLTSCRQQAVLLSNLGQVTDHSVLATASIQDATCVQYVWEACDVIQFPTKAKPEILFYLAGRGDVNENKEWLYVMENMESPSVPAMLHKICREIVAGREDAAAAALNNLMDLPQALENRHSRIADHLRKMTTNSCLPLQCTFNYHLRK